VVVGVEVASGAAVVGIGVGEGWLSQATNRRNVPNIRMRMAGLVGTAGINRLIMDWRLWGSGLGLPGIVLFTKFHLQECYPPCRWEPRIGSFNRDKVDFAPGIITKLLPIPLFGLQRKENQLRIDKIKPSTKR
jgi:hypothetical protein